ncbi:MAG: DUF2085 domain-containing protein [Actinobacteria bacterium]|nr:DUF2085 domain-containing protein [Actinomycetota bacterium]
MFLDELASQVFSFLCHQDPSRTFQPGGEPLAVCARCVGVYVGFLLALPIMIVAVRLPRKLSMYLHGALVLQVIPFGFHLIPHGRTLRTISGQLFALGVVYFLSTAIRHSKHRSDKLDKPDNPQKYAGRWLMRYLLATAQAIVLFQLLLRLDWGWIASVINVLALAGLAVLCTQVVTFLLVLSKYLLEYRRANSLFYRML